MRTKYHSFKTGNLAEGCKLCVKGRKSVLFVTGICSKKCYYCPISERKRGKDNIWINEWKTNNVKNIIEEIRLCKSFGVGITGGDPLARIKKTALIIKELKKIFGKKFHIHLYTPLELVDEKKLKMLYSAGLDEIRFHPDIDDDKLWNRILLAEKYKWRIGVEIPVIPRKEKNTKEIIDFIKNKIDFLNLNELEISDTIYNKLSEKGFKTKDKLSYAVKGSDELGKNLLKYCKRKIKNVHYCTAKLKDRVQLRNRIKLRALSIKKDYDIITEDGTLFRGFILFKNKKNLKYLNFLLKNKYNIPNNLIEIDKEKNRILVASWIVDELKKELKKENLKIGFVEEYPTKDRLEVIVDWVD